MLVAKAELNYYPEQIYEEKQKKTRKENNNRRDEQRRKQIKVIVKLISLFVAIAILSTSLFILFRYAKITKARMEVTELEKIKIELEKNKLNLLADLEGVKSTLNISEDAIYKLGMSYPKEGQIIYLSIEDSIDKTVDSANAFNRLNKVLGIFAGIF